MADPPDPSGPVSEMSAVSETNEKAEMKTATVEHVNKESLPKANVQDGNADVYDSSKRFHDLSDLVKSGQVPDKDVANSVLDLLVDGKYDMETNFIIKDSRNILLMMDLLKSCSTELEAVIWSHFTATVRKSTRNLEACNEVELQELALYRLSEIQGVAADLLIDMLGVLTSYSVSVKQLKRLFTMLQGHNKTWPRHAVKLLQVLRAMPQRCGSPEFFSFPGRAGSGIALPPIDKWPSQSGWTFHCWFRLDPVTGALIEREKPYLYCFHTTKGTGYSAHFLGNALVVTAMKVKGKGFQHCIQYDFQPRKWYMVTIVHVYSRWSKSSIISYVDGQKISSTEMSWAVNASELFEKCFLGCTPDMTSDTTFSGQISTVYCFTDALQPAQVAALHCLGSGYHNLFRFENESQQMMEGVSTKVLYDAKLMQCMMFMYTPVACEEQLCLESSPKMNVSHFVHTPHALMKEGVKAVVTNSIFSTLHSIGGIQVLFPLFGQLDYSIPEGKDEDCSICSTLMDLICNLLENSVTVQQQMLQCKGFLSISLLLEKASRKHITQPVLNSFLRLTNFLVKLPTGGPLLKPLFDHILFNPQLWIYTDFPVQRLLFQYLAGDFINTSQIYNNIRRVSSVLQTLHALKYYYWIVNPKDRSGINPRGLDGTRPDRASICLLRADMLKYLHQLVIKGPGVQEEELQAFLNYLSTVQEDDNLLDVLQLAVRLMAEHPQSMVPTFDQMRGIRPIFKLLASPNEIIRIRSLKLLGYFLMRSTFKRKHDSMVPYNLFSLLIDRLLLNQNSLSMATYNVLFELLTEKLTLAESFEPIPSPEKTIKLENPIILKVIAQLIRQSVVTPALLEVKNVYLDHLLAVCSSNKDNRRTILQMSVWQDWLFSLAYIYPSDPMEQAITDRVLLLFRSLLHHAMKHEYGGWRVWIDTLAILHSRVAYADFKIRMNQIYQQYENQREAGESEPVPEKREEDGSVGCFLAEVTRQAVMLIEDRSRSLEIYRQIGAPGKNVARSDAAPGRRPSYMAHAKSAGQNRQIFSPGPRAPPFRIPDFRWSFLHQQLLSDLLAMLEQDVLAWKKSSSQSMIDLVNAGENHVFVVNVTHMISQLIDNLVAACGGLLPLLAAATSPSGEIEMLEPNLGFTVEQAVSFLQRIMSMTDILVFASSLHFSELEHEKNMSAGGILRQCLRLVCTVAVRNCLEVRYMAKLRLQGKALGKKGHIDALIKGAKPPKISYEAASIYPCGPLPVHNYELLLQELDVNRLKAVVYRDVEETKQAQFLALAIVYFSSVLMVSKYRDILEPTGPVVATEAVQRNGEASYDEEEAASEQECTEGEEEDEAGGEVNVEEENGEEDGSGSLEASSEETPGSSGKSPPSQAGSSTAGSDPAAREGEEVVAQLNCSTAAEVPLNTNSTQPISAISSSDSVPAGPSSSEQLKVDEEVVVPMPEIPCMPADATLEQRLDQSLKTAAPLLREIFIDFAPYLSKTLTGSKGQELVQGGMKTIRLNQSVVELVMLLCSQEWQNSLQKHAGLAFIELVNEGRLLSHATRDHIVRVANEAEFILNRVRADDVQKHAEFETVCANTQLERKEEEKICDHLITSARRRDHNMALKRVERILYILENKHGPWGGRWHGCDDDGYDEVLQYWRLDNWEDDSRRRRRLVKNPIGSSHPEATLKAAIENGGDTDAINEARKAVYRHLSVSQGKDASSSAAAESNSVSEDELAMINERELDMEFTGPVSVSTTCQLIAPGVAVEGTISVTKTELYFEMDEDDEKNRKIDSKVLQYIDNIHGKWHFNEIRAIFSRRYLLQNTAIEIFLASRTAIMFAFPDIVTVKKVINALPKVGVGMKYGLPQTRRVSLATPKQLFKMSSMMLKWQRREISNFDYLMYLNTVAGRTYNDLNQYPIFPWVLVNYESAEMDLSLPSNFRDLSKPIGALNPTRRAFFEERYRSWEHEQIPPFHYGTHYSTAAFTLNWLIRVEPFTSFFLNLQEGKFDHANRTFSSVAQSWKNCQRDTSDVKELIPEFYYLPDMFINANHYCLGTDESGRKLDDVQLPNWASSPEDFVRINRMALESEFVSCQLHQWVDLIFGYKQRGPEAVRATNVFFYLTYEGNVKLQNVTDPIMREALENQIKNFGQTPVQLLTEPHPPRNSVMHITPTMFATPPEDLCMILKFLSNSPVTHVSANTHPHVPVPAVTTVSCNYNFSINKFHCPDNSAAAPAAKDQYASDKPDAGHGKQLPLAMDQVLDDPKVFNTSNARRHLGSQFDQRLRVAGHSFVTTADNRFVLAAGLWDKSFRVIGLADAKVVQAVYGHFDVVTVIARSECNVNQDCYVVTGSKDCTVKVWHWNAKQQSILGDNGRVDCPTPKGTLTGHSTPIVCVLISAELGIIVSGSKDGPLLIHTNSADLLRSLDPPSEKVCSPSLVALSREGYILVAYLSGHLCSYGINGKLYKSVPCSNQIWSMIVNRDGQYFMTGGEHRIVEVWRTHDLSMLYSFPPCESAVRALALSHDQKYLMAGLGSGSLVVFNIDFNKWHHEYQDRFP